MTSRSGTRNQEPGTFGADSGTGNQAPGTISPVSGTRNLEPGTDKEPGTAKTLIRAPNHLGDFVLSLPALAALSNADVLIAPNLAPLAELVRERDRVIRLQPGIGGMLRTATAVRRRNYQRAVLLPRSFSSALLAKVAGIPERRGIASEGRGPMLTHAVSPLLMDPLHRGAEYLTMVTGSPPVAPPTPELPIPETAHTAWRELAGETAPQIGVFPGSNASSRRWDRERFSRLVARLVKAGWSVAVFGSAEERGITALVAGTLALDLGGKTALPVLAAGLAACRLLITNDSGPMHLAAAVGTHTVSFWGAGDPRRTRPLGEHHILLRHTELPCISCQKNRCPRRGAGYYLPGARNECLALISEEEAWAAVTQIMTVPQQAISDR